jgi:raffinose/stachyose/melibiose transport system permease protein
VIDLANTLDTITTDRQRVDALGLVRRRVGRVVLYLLLISWAILTTYPFIWLLLTSLKYPYELFENAFGLPRDWLFKNYVTAWNLARVGDMSLRSLYVTVVSTILAMSLAASASFALSRFNFRFKTPIWAYIMFGFMVPETIRLLPLAMFTRKLGIYDNLLGLSIVYAATGVPWNTFFLSGFMETIPRELEEAAIMDGAGMWRVFWSIMLPLSRPALATLATYHALSSWNEFVMALMLTASPGKRTLPVGMAFLIGSFYANYPALAAAIVMSFIPSVLFFLILQRYVIKGLAAGALAGV